MVPSPDDDAKKGSSSPVPQPGDVGQPTPAEVPTPEVQVPPPAPAIERSSTPPVIGKAVVSSSSSPVTPPFSKNEAETETKPSVDPFTDIEKVRELLSKSKKEASRNQPVASKALCRNIVETVAKAKKIDVTLTFAIIAGLMQVGGANANAISRVSYSIGNVTISGEEFATVCRRSKITTRQFSKCMANEIHEIAVELSEPGDLARQMRLEVPNLSMDDQIWCANFQTENPDCPDTVRNWLVHNFNSRFRG